MDPKPVVVKPPHVAPMASWAAARAAMWRRWAAAAVARLAGLGFLLAASLALHAMIGWLSWVVGGVASLLVFGVLWRSAARVRQVEAATMGRGPLVSVARAGHASSALVFATVQRMRAIRFDGGDLVRVVVEPSADPGADASVPRHVTWTFSVAGAVPVSIPAWFEPDAQVLDALRSAVQYWRADVEIEHTPLRP